jgi:hypothetical protein
VWSCEAKAIAIDRKWKSPPKRAGVCLRHGWLSSQLTQGARLCLRGSPSRYTRPLRDSDLHGECRRPWDAGRPRRDCKRDAGNSGLGTGSHAALLQRSRLRRSRSIGRWRRAISTRGGLPRLSAGAGDELRGSERVSGSRAPDRDGGAGRGSAVRAIKELARESAAARLNWRSP